MMAWRMFWIGPASKLGEFRVVDDFGALRDRLGIRRARRAISPWSSHQAERATPGSRRKLEAGHARAEAFGFALAGVEREPDGDGLVARLRVQELADRGGRIERGIVGGDGRRSWWRRADRAGAR